MLFRFYKYHGTGNDFIIIDNRAQTFPKEDGQYIKDACRRRFGIGADGLILLEEGDDEVDFEMVYFNSDGTVSSFCGNGSRCAVHLAKRLGFFKGSDCAFRAADGLHKGRIEDSKVEINMRDVMGIKQYEGAWFLDTGSPHHVEKAALDTLNLVVKGRGIRNSPAYAPDGTNVNFVEFTDSEIHVRTYERGVEDETYSCGTGVTAVALVWALEYEADQVYVVTPGGRLRVRWKRVGRGFTDIRLIGPAQMVCYGQMEYPPR